MMKFNKLDQYLKGKLAEEEMEQFTKELVATFFQEKKLKTKWRKILAEDKELLALKKESEKQSLTNAFSINKRFFILVGRIVASILLLLVSWLLFQHINTPAPIRLADTYLAQPYELNQTRKGAAEGLRTVIKSNFEAKRYPQALATFEQLEQTTTLTVEDYFILGHVHLKLEAWQSAIVNFDKVIKHHTGTLQEEATWFGSLALVKNNNPERAIQQLEKFVTKNDWNHAEAKQLLEALKK